MLNYIPASIGILIGGKNSRLNGLKKWDIKIKDLTILERTIKISSNFKKQYLLGKTHLKIDGVSFLKDEHYNFSPLFGLHSLLKKSKYDWNFLIASDLPFISDKIFNKIWDLKQENQSAIIPFSKGKLHFTCGFYNKNLLTKIEHNIKNKQLSMKNLLKNKAIIIVKINEENFFNLNSFSDLKKFQKKLNTI